MSRRRALARGAQLLAVAPATVAALQAGSALADEDDGRRDFRREGGRGDQGPGPFSGGGGFPGPASGFFGRAGTAVRLELNRVLDVPGSDYTSLINGPSTSTQDSLGRGSVGVSSGSNGNQVFVLLEGAAGSASYNLYFVRFNDHGREGIGSFSTDGNGRADAQPGSLSGGFRAGLFLISRSINGTEYDEFIASIRPA